MWTREAILQAREAQQVFISEGFRYGLKAIFGSTFPLGLLGWIRDDFNYFFVPWLVVILACLRGGGQLAGLLLTYFSPPTWLTLGHKIGGFMPTDCHTSQLVEGRGRLAWPCQALDFKNWVLHVAGLADGQPHVQFDPMWFEYLAWFFIFLLNFICIARIPRSFDRDIKRREQEQQREKESREEKEQLRIKLEMESGIAGGVEAWKAGGTDCRCSIVKTGGRVLASRWSSRSRTATRGGRD